MIRLCRVCKQPVPSGYAECPRAGCRRLVEKDRQVTPAVAKPPRAPVDPRGKSASEPARQSSLGPAPLGPAPTKKVRPPTAAPPKASSPSRATGGIPPPASVPPLVDPLARGVVPAPLRRHPLATPRYPRRVAAKAAKRPSGTRRVLTYSALLTLVAICSATVWFLARPRDLLALLGRDSAVSQEEGRSDQGSPQVTPTANAEPVDVLGTRVLPFFQRHCSKCHGAEKANAELNFAAYGDWPAILRDRPHWEKVIEQLRQRTMPPPEEPAPDEKEIEFVASWLDDEFLKLDRQGFRDPGRVTIRRLNRAEYDNTIRDLMGIDFHAAADFPADDVGYGFDNIGDVLSMSPILLEKYLAAAETIVDKAIPPPGPDPLVRAVEADSFEVNGGGKVDRGVILSSNGAVAANFDLPTMGRYFARARAYGHQAGDEPARMTARVDGVEKQTFDVTAVEGAARNYEFEFTAPAGHHRVSFEFINDYYRPEAPDPKQRDRNLIIEHMEVVGPRSTAVEMAETARRILFVTPEDGKHDGAAREILGRFASKAFRRPAAAEEIERLVDLTTSVEADGGSFEDAIRLAVQAVLVSPHFLFRVEIDPEPNNPKASRDLTQFELASRLSYFLWSSMPDDELTRLAAEGRLSEPDRLEAQVRRMLTDPKSRAIVDNFATQWLQTRNLAIRTPDPSLFPTFDDDLRAAMRIESERFFEGVLREDRPLLDFLDSDYTYLNERLARHYGIEGVTGPEFRKVTLAGDRRGGVLTQASVLLITSNPTRTSPVKRGKWILEQILGTPPPPPPPGVEELKDDQAAMKGGSLRQRMEAHRANPNCATCHARMDPLGFGLENYDAIGAWRDLDGAFPIDASGVLPGGKTFSGPKPLKAILLARKADFTRSFAEKMLTYALGRGVERHDRLAVDSIADAAAADGYKMSRLIVEIVKSDPFRKRRGQAPP